MSTPRTDQLVECDYSKVDEEMGAEYPAYRRMVEHARELERDLAKARNCAEMLSSECRRAQADAIISAQQRDTLAEALTQIAKYSPDTSSGYECAYIAEQALAAVKGGQP